MLTALARSKDSRARDEFASALSGYAGSKYVYLSNSGISSFYIILRALKQRYAQKEVVLPAYTAGSLVVAAQKAGLKVVLCDISLEDFNADRAALMGAVSDKTLAATVVHMFGIGVEYIENLRKDIRPDVFIIEDCAQAMGTIINNRRVGAFADASFFSFARGKNLTAYGGGSIMTRSEKMYDSIRPNYDELIKPYTKKDSVRLPLETLIFCLAVNPVIYGLGYPLISRFKDVRPPKDFSIKTMTPFQAALALALMKQIDALSLKRFENGIFLINALNSLKGLTLPKISSASRPAFNRLPVLFRDLDARGEVERRMARAGIETSRMYSKPLHHIFDLGYKKESFPNACYLAEHLLTFPVHPSVRENDLARMADIISGVIR